MHKSPLLLSLSLLLPALTAQDAARELIPELQAAVEKIHTASDVPGLSVALIRDREIFWAEGFGSKRAGSTQTEDQVDASTLFQAASISKPISAMGAMRMVQAGELELDEPVDSALGDWSLDYEEGADGELTTLRKLLCHTGGTTVHGFPGYPRGKGIPDIYAVLEGAGNTAPILVDVTPGTRFRYSGGGYSIMQLMMMENRGESFPSIMRELVLQPIGMAGSSFEQPLPESRWSEAAHAHDLEGEAFEVAWNDYPEMAAAGLWTTPSDLARAMLAMDASRLGENEKFLSSELTQEMLSRQPRAAQAGLGWRLGEARGQKFFGHGGSNRGFKCDARYLYEEEVGIVVMINSDRNEVLGKVSSAILELIVKD
ncbi:MAG: serine hydrolase domain-containing protein [Planctomycetota bacterium]|jgi:CubicO group peptidase (beta-lactamase class C family)